MTEFGEGIDRGVQNADLLGDALVDSSPMIDIRKQHGHHIIGDHISSLLEILL